MKYKILEDLDDFIDMNLESTFEFKKVCGFTFVFVKNILTIRDSIASAEIRPAGIIYEENDEYYFAPLYDVDNIEAIIKEFVKTL